MKYRNIYFGTFLDRPNRFVAHVEIEGQRETVHVKNTGRCRELLIPGVRVALEKSENPNRKTAFDLVAVFKESFGHWINIDSQAPNLAAGEWLARQDFDLVKPEYTYGKSRIDFYMERGEEKFLMEVKGCTLERDGIGYFPDAPTTRGTKHLRELIGAKEEGYRSVISFVIPMEGVREVRANRETDPAFAKALEEAKQAGVEVWHLLCHVEAEGFEVVEMVR